MLCSQQTTLQTHRRHTTSVTRSDVTTGLDHPHHPLSCLVPRCPCIGLNLTLVMTEQLTITGRRNPERGENKTSAAATQWSQLYDGRSRWADVKKSDSMDRRGAQEHNRRCRWRDGRYKGSTPLPPHTHTALDAQHSMKVALKKVAFMFMSASVASRQPNVGLTSGPQLGLPGTLLASLAYRRRRHCPQVTCALTWPAAAPAAAPAGPAVQVAAHAVRPAPARGARSARRSCPCARSPTRQGQTRKTTHARTAPSSSAAPCWGRA